MIQQKKQPQQNISTRSSQSLPPRRIVPTHFPFPPSATATATAAETVPLKVNPPHQRVYPPNQTFQLSATSGNNNNKITGRAWDTYNHKLDTLENMFCRGAKAPF